MVNGGDKSPLMAVFCTYGPSEGRLVPGQWEGPDAHGGEVRGEFALLPSRQVPCRQAFGGRLSASCLTEIGRCSASRRIAEVRGSCPLHSFSGSGCTPGGQRLVEGWMHSAGQAESRHYGNRYR